MNIIVWGINYAPEVTGIGPCNTALCEYLSGAGHQVRMLTTFAYYPGWQKLPGDQGRLYRTDQINGVEVHRCWHYVPRRVTAFQRMLHEGTFVLSSLARLLWLPRPNLVVAVSPPLSLGVAAWAAGWVKRAPFIFHVQDLQPDAAAGLGLVKSRWLLPLLYRLERFAYRKAARVGGISPGMLAAFQRKGVPAEKCLYFPNSIVLTPAAPPPAPGSFRRRHGFAPDDFLIVYSGNLGVKQGLDVLLEVARLGGQPRARFVLCGDGNQREALAAKAARDRLSHVHLLPLQPAVQYQEMLHDADVCAITQQSGAGQCFFPSKLLPALAAGKAVLAVAEADSELARAVATGGFGLWVPPGQPVPLALAIGELIGQPEKLAAFGQAALRFVAQFERTRVLRRFTVELGKLTELFSVGP